MSEQTAPVDYMAEWKEFGRTPEGLRTFAEKLMWDRQLGGGYAACVLKSAAAEIERLTAELKNERETFMALDRQHSKALTMIDELNQFIIDENL